MKSDRLRWLAVLGSLALLSAVWLMEPVTPAIYDGLPIGTPPYRYLAPPKGTPHTPPPGAASVEVVLANYPTGVTLATGEPKPQADVSIPTQLLDIPAGTSEVRVGVAPVLPPVAAPGDGKIDGNVYRIAVTTLAGQPLKLKAGDPQLFQVELLGTGSSREPHVEQYADGSWVHVPFVHPESGIFQFHPSQPGEFALVLPPDRSVFGPGLTSALAVGGALVVLASILAVVRRRRSRALTSPMGQEGDGAAAEDSEVGAE